MNFRVVSIHGVPRSGTSWLGQIYDSHPDTAYRHQPLFSYRFKDRLNVHSTRDEISRFLQELYEVTHDDFILDASRRQAAMDFWEKAIKQNCPSFLVMKMVRYHHLLALFLEKIETIQIIGIVRHPCAVINSWLQAPKEFRAEWNAQEEWRYASKKNAGRIEEFNGFEKWKEVAHLFLQLERDYPDRFCITQYEHLVTSPLEETTRLFDFAGLPMHPQTVNFIRFSHSQHDEDPYSVIKNPGAHRRWQTELDLCIANQIVQEVCNTTLERFLA